MNALVRLLLVICAVLVADALAAEPNAGNPDGQPPSQPSSDAPLGAIVSSPAAPPSVTNQQSTTADPSVDGKSEMEAKSPRTATSPANANARTVEQKSTRGVLVDDTVNDAQLKQILAKGYRPTKQVAGNEVSYCRREQLAGQRFLTTVCKTATRILEDEQRGKDLLSGMDRIGQQMGR